MQFFILFTGVMVFVFYLFHPAPINFNQQAIEEVRKSEQSHLLLDLETQYEKIYQVRKQEVLNMAGHISNGNEVAAEMARSRVLELEAQSGQVREETRTLIASVNQDLETNDRDYVFITFIMNILPIGVIGLLMAVIFSAAMSSTSAELNALASTATVDIYKRNFKKQASEKHYLLMSRAFTLLFGILAILFAVMASLFENLIQAVNILGSLFYGAILGVFISAFFVKWIKGTSVFIGALLAEACVIIVYFLDQYGIVQVEYLWLNLIGCVLVVFFGSIIQLIRLK
jgi:solute:Na+ symporter, SSS family